MVINNGRTHGQNRTRLEDTHRQSPRTPQIVGTTTFGSGNSSETARYKNKLLPDCIKGLLGELRLQGTKKK